MVYNNKKSDKNSESERQCANNNIFDNKLWIFTDSTSYFYELYFYELYFYELSVNPKWVDKEEKCTGKNVRVGISRVGISVKAIRMNFSNIVRILT